MPGYEHDPTDRARPRGVPAQVRAGQGRAARARRAAGDRHAPASSTPSPATGSPARDYALPDIHLAPDEAAAVGIAARLWQHAGLAAAPRPGLVKLRAAGVDVDPHATLGVEPVVTVDPAFEPLHRRGPGPAGGHVRLPRAGATTPPRPAGSSRGAWSPGAAAGTWSATTSTAAPTRCFRLSRVVGAVRRRRAGRRVRAAGDVDLISHVAQLVRPGRAHRAGPPCWSGPAGRAGVRRWRRAAGAGAGRRPAGAALLRPGRLAGWLVGYGADVVVLEPAGGPQGGRGPAADLAGADVRRGRGASDRVGPARDRRPVTATGSADRLGRLLNLVPYLLARPGIRVAEAAADLGVSERQLREDLELLWVCGLPGYGPGDLIDMAFDGDRVTVTYDAGIDRPLRLTPDEALALVVALRMLAEVPGRGRAGTAVERALAKIESAAGDAADGRRSRSACPARAEPARPSCRARSQRRRALRLHVLHAPPATRSPSGWSTRCGCCWSAAARTWRRGAAGPRRSGCSGSTASTRCTELDEPAAPPPGARADRRAATACSRPAPDLPLVTLRVGRWARWITEYYPCERVVEDAPDRWLVSLRASDLAWARRLVLGLGPEVDRGRPAGAGRGGPDRGPGRAGRLRRSDAGRPEPSPATGASR